MNDAPEFNSFNRETWTQRQRDFFDGRDILRGLIEQCYAIEETLRSWIPVAYLANRIATPPGQILPANLQQVYAEIANAIRDHEFDDAEGRLQVARWCVDAQYPPYPLPSMLIDRQYFESAVQSGQWQSMLERVCWVRPDVCARWYVERWGAPPQWIERKLADWQGTASTPNKPGARARATPDLELPEPAIAVPDAEPVSAPDHSEAATAEQTREITRVSVFKADIDGAYCAHRDEYREREGKYPSRDTDWKWGAAQSPKIRRDRIRQLREAHIPPDIRNGGAPKKPVRK